MSALTLELSEEAETLLDKLESLSEKDREGIVKYLFDRLEGPTEDQAAVRRAWKAELERRIADIDSGNIVGEPIEEMFRKARKS